MIRQLINKPHAILRLEQSPFRKILESYSEYLIEKGYSSSSSGQRYLQCVEHFMNWLGINKCASDAQIDKTLMKEFIFKHLPICQCQLPAQRHFKTVRAALNSLLNMLKIERIIGSDKHSNPEINKVINDFNNYLEVVCGLSVQTRHYRRRYAEEFLNSIFNSDPIQISRLTPAMIENYFGEHAKNYKPSSFGVMAVSLRCFFKFLEFSGLCKMSLAAGIPHVPNWKLTTLPHYLQQNQIEKLLQSCDQNAAIGKRDYAILRCMTDLGMRGSEVAALKLEDINWRSRVIHLSRGKSRQGAILPLPLFLMEALIDYLKNGRPLSSVRQVFVFHQAPIGQAITPHVVRQALRSAYQRAGFTPPSQGPHLLRKSFATHLLQKGVALKEIADILRHQSINTTLIYTKVDLPNLEQVAASWLWRSL